MIKNPTLSQKTVDRMFPVSFREYDRWFEVGLKERWKDIVCRCATRYQADIEYAAQQADHLEVHSLVRRVKTFYRRCRINHPKIEKLFNLAVETQVGVVVRIAKDKETARKYYESNPPA